MSNTTHDKLNPTTIEAHLHYRGIEKISFHLIVSLIHVEFKPKLTLSTLFFRQT